MEYNIIKYFKRYLTASIAMAVMVVLPDGVSGQQASQQKPLDSITVTVKNSEGIRLADVSIVVGEGVMHLKTDPNGESTLSIPANSIVNIYKSGYQRRVISAMELMSRSEVTLTSEKLFASEDDDIHLPFATIKKRYSVGGSIVITGEELEAYGSSSDIRNALTGLVSGVEVIENNGAPGMTMLERAGRWDASNKVSINGRGRALIYMLDGIPVDISDTPLDPLQIETVTIIKDVVEKNLYGPFASNGIVYIKTKTGAYNERILNVNVEAGISVIDRMPEYVNGVEYARLNNIARNNSGVEMLYTKEDVAAYAKNDPYDMFHPNVNFRDMMMRNTMNYQRVNVSSGGGNETLKYFAYLGYTGEGDVFKIGPTSKYDRLNLSSNIDARLNNFIKARLGIFSSISYRKSPNYGYSSEYANEDGSKNTTIGMYEFPDAIKQINKTPAIAFPVYANNDPELASPWYAVSQAYNQNPIGNMMKNGSYTETTRKGMINAEVHMDFSFVTPGLSATSYGAFDAANMTRLGKAEDYDAYLITKGWDINGNVVPDFVKSGSHTVSDMANKTKLADFMSQRFFGSQKIAYTRSFGKHDVDAAVTAFITKRTIKFVSEHCREVTGAFSARYAYDDRYLFQTAMSYSGTYSLKNNRSSFSPTFGVGWIISQEKFMSNVKQIDFLKLKAEGGVMYHDASMSAYRDMDNYKWNDSGQGFGPHTNNQWFGSTTTSNTVRVYPGLIGNANLRLEKRQEFSVGIEGLALARRLSFEVNYYNILNDGPVTNVENIMPLLIGLGDAETWMNYNQTRYYGFEVAVGFREKRGDFSYSVNLNTTVQSSKVVRSDEINQPYSYMSKVGYPNSAIFGLKYAGKFATDAETNIIPQLFDEELHAGDMKYVDMNGDGVIDDNDRCFIGNSAPKMFFGLRINLRYKDFDLGIIGSGRAFYDIAMTNDYFWNGWGDDNYSKFVLDTHNGGKYPKLTYNKVNNNYKTSDFWLKDGSYFKLQNVEVGYNMPVKKWNLKSIRGMRFYVKGSNLLTISKIKGVDPESIDSGVNRYPLFRSFVAGIKLTF